MRARRPLAPDVMTAGVWGLKIELCSQHRETEERRGEERGMKGRACTEGDELRRVKRAGG